MSRMEATFGVPPLTPDTMDFRSALMPPTQTAHGSRRIWQVSAPLDQGELTTTKTTIYF